MKFKFLFSLLLGAGALSAFAQGGYQDGIDYYNADRFEDAQIILTKTLNDNGTNKALSYFYLGSIDLREKKTASAKEYFEKGIAADANCGYNYVGLGQIALAAGDKNTAQNQFKQALKVGGKDAKVMTAVARAYFNVDPVVYAKEIDKNIKDAFKASKNLESAVYVLQGDMVTNDPGKAAGLYEQAITYDLDKNIVNPEAYVKYANVYFKVSPKFAIDKLIELNQKLPTSALAQRELAEKYYENNQFTMAADQYGKYMQNPNHFQRDEQRYSGLLYFGQKYNESLNVAKKVLAADPTNHYMQRMVLLNECALGHYAEAKAAGDKLFSAPGAEFTFNDYSTYGDVLNELKDYDGAIKAYQEALKIRPDKWDVYSKMSSTYTSMEDYKKAVDAQQKFVDNGGDDVSLTDLFVLSNRYKNLAITAPEESAERKAAAVKGLEYIDQAIANAAEESRPSLYRNRATLLMLRDGSETTQELVDTYNNMLAIYDRDAANKTAHADAYKSAYNVIASFYRAKGDMTTARKYYEMLLSVDPDNDDLRNYLKNLK